MKIELHRITVRELVDGYVDDEGNAIMWQNRSGRFCHFSLHLSSAFRYPLAVSTYCIKRVPCDTLKNNLNTLSSIVHKSPISIALRQPSTPSSPHIASIHIFPCGLYDSPGARTSFFSGENRASGCWLRPPSLLSYWKSVASGANDMPP